MVSFNLVIPLVFVSKQDGLLQFFKKQLIGKGCTIHTLRHTFATSLLNKDVSLVNIKDLMGHKSLESMKIYLHVTGKELISSINTL